MGTLALYFLDDFIEDQPLNPNTGEAYVGLASYGYIEILKKFK